jgi:hypothetical protein
MKSTLNNHLSPASRVWVYQSTTEFTPEQAAAISEKITSFVNQWTAHKMEVTGDGALLYNRFIVLMADETEVGVSGCSVDSSVHFVRQIGAEFGANFFDRWNIAYKKGEAVLSCNRDEFEKLVALGEIKEDTTVFNNLVQTKADFDTKWQILYKDSWLKNLAPADKSFGLVL